jgi:pentatricopeptide repeat protein
MSSYFVAIAGRATSKRGDAIEQAEYTLLWLDELYKAGDQAACLEKISNTFSNRGYPGLAEMLLNKMIKNYYADNRSAKPDLASFKAVISGWMRFSYFRPWGAPQRAESLLGRMWALHFGGRGDFDVRPDRATYNMVIACWKNSKNAHRADQLFREMHNKYKFGQMDEGPDNIIFRIVQQAWLESSDADKVGRVRALQREFKTGLGRKGRRRSRKKAAV